MGRIKKYHDSWRASGLWLRFQYPKIDDDETTTAKTKKNTRKWCKGKVGVHHEKYLVERHKFLDWVWETWECKNCHKKFHESIR